MMCEHLVAMLCPLVAYHLCLFIKLVGPLFHMLKPKDYVKNWLVSGGLKAGNCGNVTREALQLSCLTFILFEESELFPLLKRGLLGIESVKKLYNFSM